MKLKDAFRGRENNLGLMRLAAALAVILSHSFVLAAGQPDPVSAVTGGQATFGQLAVLLFFFFGGLLIMKSMENKKTAGPYFRARCLRIFPSLWMVVLLCVLVLGPAVSALGPGAYFGSAGTWKYLLNGVLVPVHTLPGVFEGHANTAVNGSLWTLPVEFVCYILCYVFYKAGLAEKKRPLMLLPLAAAGAFAGWRLLSGNEALQGAVLPVLFFYIGMVCWLFRDRIPLNGFAAAGALAVMVASVPLKIYPAAVCVTYPYVLLYLGFGTSKKAAFVGRKLELSYGIYLTGFPVQQVLIHCFPEMGAAVNFLLAACLSAALSVPITLLDQRIAKRFGKA